MTLFNLALKNIRRNMKSYGLYIGSTIFSIIIFFTFATLKHSGDISGLAEKSKQISGIMSASSFVLIIFVAIFILYSNSFFMRKRKKEVALYSLMGVRKQKIGFLLFFENMVIGLVSLIIGVGLGFFLSQFLLSLLLKLMGLDIEIGLAFSPNAVVETMIVFLIIFLFTSLQGYRVIYRFKLIELFHASKKGEELPKARIISVILGLAALAGAYWFALQDVTSEAWRILSLSMPIVIIALTVLGTYFIFNSVLVYVLHILKKRNTWAWKGLNLMTASQLLYRIRGNAKTLTIIAALSATTITAGGAVFGLYYDTEKNVQQYTPFSFMWEGQKEAIDDSIVKESIRVDTKHIRINSEQIEKEYTVIDHAAFEKLAEALEWDMDTLNLAKDEVGLIEPFYEEQGSEDVKEISFNHADYEVGHVYGESIFNISTVPGTVIVAHDEVYNDLDAVETTYQAVQVNNYKEHLDLSQELEAKASTVNFSSAVQDYQDSLEGTGIMLFVGTFLGLVFLVATGSIIFFKLMTEAEDDKDKYFILYKIGVPKKEMKRTIRYQAGFLFIAPLLLGLLHGTVALIAFSSLFQMELWVPITIWMLAYVFIYMMYYFITIRGFYKTIFNTIQEGN
ncbi:FtsX-like permease family protein [Oceanobacillus sp. FSL H7-0719]|uniref:FtsX-like permease family protein n=1 Tax=Oceanobacillus sp. FSL H7-0719 TaxID=2954507 RepID=UPI003245AB6E